MATDGFVLLPGRPRLIASGILSAAATASTAAAFFGVAAIAQDVLTRTASWSLDAGWLGFIAFASAVRATGNYAAARLAADGALAVGVRLRARLLERLLGGSGSSLTSAARATAVIDEVERVVAYAERYVPAKVAAVLVPLVLLTAVIPLSWPVAVLLALAAPLPPLNLSVVGMGATAVARKHGEELRHLSGYFLDRLRGLATLRALGAEQAELARVSAASTRLAETSMAVLRVAFLSAAILEAIVTISVAVVAMYVGLTLLGYIQVPGLPIHMSLRTGLFLLMVTPLYFQPVRALAAAYHERADALAAMEALAPLLEDRPRQVAVPLIVAPSVEVDHLIVAFPERETPALNDVSLSVRPRELVGITGPSGVGKSTLLRAVAGEIAATSGSVWLGGHAATEVAGNCIAWLGQRPYLFPGTIGDNVALGLPDATEAQVGRAAVEAGLGDVLARLPLGLSTAVGETGWGMSGGEAQRVSLARAFLSSAPLVLLDEPTAHLDAATEYQIVPAIRRLTQHATTIVATHSPRLLAACDRVIELDRGGVVVTTRPVEVMA